MKELLLFTRREFLRATSIVAVGAGMPRFLANAAAAADPALALAGGRAPIKGFKDDRILVVVQLGGGNDGLNTVIPFTDDAYYKARPKLGLKGGSLLRINDQIALNARMKGMKELADQGKMTLIEGVGYPNPSRSHFRSMEIWHAAVDSDRPARDGWVGSYLDNSCSGEAEPVAAVAVGGERPDAFRGEKGLGVAFSDPNSFGWTEGQGDAKEGNFRILNAAARPENDTLDFLRKVTTNAVISSDRVREVARGYKGGVQYPGDQFGASLQTVAKMIAGGLPTRIYYVSLTGFDTHANQLNSHENLLQRFSDGVSAFQRDMVAQGNADRVLTMSFSEFGRRVAENASGGTDHGTAAPMFLIGDMVNAGVAGKRPSLTDLDKGDLKYTTDFRGIYASVVDQWLGADSATILGRAFSQTDLIRKTVKAAKAA